MINDNIVLVLIALAGMIVFILVILIFVLFIMNFKEKRKIKLKKQEELKKKQVKKSEIIYTAEPISEFMNFEKIEDNMILQKNGKYLMIVECQGINYDLMSEMEKTSVEQGFIAFLNTLRFPIQIYIQTRTINLERSVEGYKHKLKEIEQKYNNLEIEYENLLKNPKADKEEIEKEKYELVKQKNLKDYTADIIRDIGRQSLNQNILNKRYYVVIACYKSEISTGDFSDEEVKNMAFSELYTRCRAVINSLFACQVSGKILDSDGLMELLYIAYNRDESDLFWMEKMKKAGFNELYSTAPDVLDKKIQLLDKQIEEKSIKIANEKINEARREKEIEIMEREKNEKQIANNKAKELIKKHKKFVGEKVANRAIEKIEKEQKEEGANANVKKEKK